jgi:hypothetical protein
LYEDEDGLMARETGGDFDVLGIQDRKRGQGISAEKGHHRTGEGPEFPLDVVAGPGAKETRLVRHFVDVGKRAWGNSREQESRPDRGNLGDELQGGVASFPPGNGSFLAQGVLRKVEKIEVEHLGHRGGLDASPAPRADEDSCGGVFPVGDLPQPAQGRPTMPGKDRHLTQTPGGGVVQREGPERESGTGPGEVGGVCQLEDRGGE